jgi:hypothetical protein
MQVPLAEVRLRTPRWRRRSIGVATLFGPSTEGTALRIQPGVFGTAANLLAWMADLPASGVAVKV